MAQAGWRLVYRDPVSALFARAASPAAQLAGFHKWPGAHHRASFPDRPASAQRMQSLRTTENSGEDSQLITVLNRFRARLPVVRVDAIGVGHNFALHLRDHRFRVDMVNVTMQCESKRQPGVNDRPAICQPQGVLLHGAR
jgi:hypothetical protein